MKSGLRYILPLAAVLIVGSALYSRESGGRAIQDYMKVRCLSAQVVDDGAVTRLQLRLVGRPHTAGRIDSVHVIGADSVGRAAVDIDGVDFQRWFQWEDEPDIDIELDLPGAGYNGSETLLFFGPRGNVKCKIDNCE